MVEDVVVGGEALQVGVCVCVRRRCRWGRRCEEVAM